MSQEKNPKVMNNRAPQLQGHLDLELNQHPIKMECEGQSIKLTFSSFRALLKFIAFYKKFNQQQFSITQKITDQLQLQYFIGKHFVGESHAALHPNWVGRYVGVEKSKVYFPGLLNYFLRRK
jgi:hypothetical protein